MGKTMWFRLIKRDMAFHLDKCITLRILRSMEPITARSHTRNRGIHPIPRNRTVQSFTESTHRPNSEKRKQHVRLLMQKFESKQRINKNGGLLYFSLIRPGLENFCTVWNPYTCAVHPGSHTQTRNGSAESG